MTSSKRNYLSRVVDIERIPAEGDSSTAIRTTQEEIQATFEADVIVCGGGLGGVAAAIAALETGVRVFLLEETRWLGGQATSQGVSALDEHEWIEKFGGTKLYYKFRQKIREYYANKVSSEINTEYLNPGKCWVSSLAFEPHVAVEVLEELLSEYNINNQLSVLKRVKVFACNKEGSFLKSVDVSHLDTGDSFRICGSVFIDATEMGDILPLADIPYRVGAEAYEETKEPHAPVKSVKTCVQGCTYPFVLEKMPKKISSEKPLDEYLKLRDEQPYSYIINIHGDEGAPLQYALYKRLEGTPGSFWNYRRLIAAEQFEVFQNDLSMINWPGNDYYSISLLDLSPEELAAALQKAKRLSLGFAYWLHTESSLPESLCLKLRKDIMNSQDGLSLFPYIREARRIVPLRTISEGDVSADLNKGCRARQFKDAVGIGYYSLDVHDTCDGSKGFFIPTKPFQIPLSALIPETDINLIAGAKNLGVTHITNGCYRLHPVEWNVGEVAGLLAAFQIEKNVSSVTVLRKDNLRLEFQQRCLKRGIPCSWLLDIPPSHPNFYEIHLLVLFVGPPSADSLNFEPEMEINTNLKTFWENKIKEISSEFAVPDYVKTHLDFAKATAGFIGNLYE